MAHAGTSRQLLDVAQAVARIDDPSVDDLVALMLSRATSSIGIPETVPLDMRDPNLAVVLALIKSPRLPCVPRVGSDLEKVLLVIRGRQPDEQQVVAALRRFPSTWHLAEMTLLNTLDFVPWNLDLIDIADDVADHLFCQVRG